MMIASVVHSMVVINKWGYVHLHSVAGNVAAVCFQCQNKVNQVSANIQPNPDRVLVEIANYVCEPPEFSTEAWKTAKYSFLDTLGCGLLTLNYPDCARLLSPVVPGAEMANGIPILGTPF